jgi:thymidylate synthase
LSCQLYQRSADIFLGVPFNIASYALLTHMVAQQCDLDVGDFIWTGGDCHIYSNHHEQVELQLSRAPMAYPTLHIKRKPDSIFDYQFEDFEVQGYECHGAIKAPGGRVGDTKAPPFGASWKEVSRESHTSATGLNYSFVTYKNT